MSDPAILPYACTPLRCGLNASGRPERFGVPLPDNGATGSRPPPALTLPDPHPPGAPAALERLLADCAACRCCGLAAHRQQVVVGRGNPRARLLLIGEAPGAQEDASGAPFVGRSGQLLNQLLADGAIDPDRDAYLCNVVKCRPPANRRPTPGEVAACRPWLDAQIRLVDPAVILLVGATALEAVLGIRGGITRLRGQWHGSALEPLAGRRLMAILHPSYLLRHASRQEGSPRWHTGRDLQEVRRVLDGLAVATAAVAVTGFGHAPALRDDRHRTVPPGTGHR
jgi:uracil-DNA glycosylase